MLENNKIKRIKEYRNKGLSYQKIAEKMNISTKTAMKYGKEEKPQEVHENPEAKNPIAEDSVVGEHMQETTTPSMTYPHRFKFIEAINLCENAIERLRNKDYGPYNTTVEILTAKYEYVLVLLQKYDNEGLEALTELNKELEKFDTEYNTADSLKGDITRLRREKKRNIEENKTLEEENKAQEEKFKQMAVERQKILTDYDHRIAEKKEDYKKLKVENNKLGEMKASGQRAVANIIEEGKKQAQYWYKQIDNLRYRYNTTMEFGEMIELKPVLENTIIELTRQLSDIKDTISLQENREILRKPLENLVDVVEVMPLDLFLKLCEVVEKRKATDPYFIQEDITNRILSNQPYTHEDVFQMMMAQMANAMTGEDELDKIIKFKKLEEMM